MIDYFLFIKIAAAGLIAFIVVFVSIPTILKVADSKHLYDEPGKRSVHKVQTPNLGGLALFFGIILTFQLYGDLFQNKDVPFLIPSALIIFSIGIKDDIMITAPIIKLLGQLLTAFIIVGLGDIRITDFHLFFEWEPDYLLSLLFSILFVVFIINGYNLIDGVDGLASVTGIVTISTFSIWFYGNGNETMPVLGTIIVGSLLAFTYYNLFSKNQKIFMGDTGSLLIGFFVAVFAIKFMESNVESTRASNFFQTTSAPAVAMGVLVVPIIDTLRVFFRRISRGQSPFAADKSHIHHRLLTLGLSHFHITMIISGANLLFILSSFLLKDIGTIRLLLVNLCGGWIVFQLPSLLVYNRRKKMLKERVDYSKKTADDY